MKVDRLARPPAVVAAVRDEISKFFDAKVPGRVCGPHCAHVCESCGSIACQCKCSAQCEDINRALSIDPDRYPIEEKIAPLVFEMKRLGVFRPVWSCEGHLKPDGTLWKLPEVWFYCDSLIHVRLLADGLKLMAFEKKLQATWEVRIAFSEPDNSDITFALAPNLTHGERPRLDRLQAEAATIAASLERFMGDEARKLQRSIT